jgi:3-oxoacyl-[acyl-carrier-protein] synthase II
MTVVVTGLGAVSSAGCGRTALAAAFLAATPQLSEVDHSRGYHRADGARLAALSASCDLSPWLDRRAARRMCQASRHAVAAARMALDEARVLDLGVLEPDTLPVLLATAYGSAYVTEDILRQIFLESPEMVSPALFTESVANAPAAQVALAIKAKGANVAITQRQAGPLIAVAKGMNEIKHKRARAALVGAVDEVNPLIHAILDRFGALVRPDSEGREIARPFDRHRGGFLAGDGATLLLIEEESAARQRGAPCLARIVAAGNAFDPDAPRTGWSDDPSRLGLALRSFLDRSGIEARSVDCVVSGGCGLHGADRLEALIIRSLWQGHDQPAVLAPKSLLGEHGGALLGAAIVAATGAPFGPTPGFVEVDPELGVTPFAGDGWTPPQRVLTIALAAGGAASWLVLDRIDPPPALPGG